MLVVDLTLGGVGVRRDLDFGMVGLALGGQGAIRLLIDNSVAGLLSWLPGGFAAQFLAYVAIAVGGAVLAGWGADQARKAGKLA